MPTSAPEDLSLHEMLRIIDVARELHEAQDAVEREFSREETIALIRERLLASAEITGDNVTPEEIEVAIELYFGNLHKFPAPPGGVQTALAHLWVMRRQIISSTLAVGAVALLGWWLFFATSGPFSPVGRKQRALADHWQSVSNSVASIEAMSTKPDVVAEVKLLQGEAETARKAEDIERLADIRARLRNLDVRLQEEYEVRIVSGENRQSGIDRYFTDDTGTRTSGYYLIVEARAPDGRVLERSIHNAESDRDERVSVWGERVPQEVYDAIKRDKQTDGVLDETLFAVKRRGQPEEVVVMKNPFGNVVERSGQITKW